MIGTQSSTACPPAHAGFTLFCHVALTPNSHPDHGGFYVWVTVRSNSEDVAIIRAKRFLSSPEASDVTIEDAAVIDETSIERPEDVHEASARIYYPREEG